MRIAVVHWSRQKVGGAESYLEQVISALADRGHEIACLFEVDGPTVNPLIALPAAATTWCVQDIGSDKALRELRRWQPEVIYAHGMLDPSLEERVIGGIPAVFFAHAYYGTCISGNKAFAFPIIEPCNKRFGPECLLHYFPRRCGGLNPLSMIKSYSVQAQRLRLLSRYERLAVASEHMALEYQRHGLKAAVIPFWTNDKVESMESLSVDSGAEIHLLFVGRMEKLKGGQLLLDALAPAAKALQRNLVCHFAGAGRAETAWLQQAAAIMALSSSVKVIFHGWLQEEQRQALMRKAHLLVVPSVWPEPFGLVGLEAGKLGLPAAAFDVGGIRQWLHDGINGVLANAMPPLSANLALAIVTALDEPSRYQELRDNAARIATEQFGKEQHLSNLERLLQEAASHRKPPTYVDN